MRKTRGFKLRRKLTKICKWVKSRKLRRRRGKSLVFSKKKRNPISKVLDLARSLQRGAKNLMFCTSSFSKSGYVQLGHEDPVDKKPGRVGIPKGHLAVYVGESQDETRRYLVPVIYFNHPLFGELLKEAEKVYGFNHPGRITIPCGTSKFEKVQMRIASGEEYCQRRRIVKQVDSDHYWWR